MFKFEARDLESCCQPTRIVDVDVYQENANWYLSVTWEYTDSEGRLINRIFPKLGFPFYNFRLPTVYAFADDGEHYLDHLMNPGQLVLEAIPTLYAYPATFTYDDGEREEACFWDVCVDEGVKEMTIEEIERMLGHRIKIVNEHTNKEEDNE